MTYPNPALTPVKHLALFLPTLVVGGAERVTLELAGSFARRGLAVDLVLVKAVGAFLTQVPPGVRVVDLNSSSAYTCLPPLLGYLHRERPQVFISTLVLTDLIAQISGRLAQAGGFRPLMVIRLATTISQLPRSTWKKRLERVLVRHIFPWADEIVADSRGVARDLQEYAGIPAERMRLIYDPIITPALRAQMAESADHPWFTPDFNAALVVGMGRLSPEKDFAPLLRAFALARRSLPPGINPPKLVILGDGPERPRLESLIGELGLQGEADLPGFVMNPGAYLKRAKIFVLSSIFEGLPGALIQGMACGCALVSTDCPSGPAEILDGGKYGHLVPVGDAPALAQALCTILAGDERLAPPQWLRQFEEETVIGQYLEMMNAR